MSSSQTVQQIVSGNNVSLATEFDPSNLPISGRTAHCLGEIPIQKAFDDLNDCYVQGNDLKSCRSSLNYDDSYTAFQSCLAGTESTTMTAQNNVQTVATTNNQATTNSFPQSSMLTASSSPSSSSVTKWIVIGLQAINLIVCITILLLAFFSKE